MKKKKILVYGYFGYENNQLDGQTIKTRSIYELLKNNVAEINMTVDYFDTQTFKKNSFNLLKSWYLISKYDILFYLPAHNNLKYLFPFIFFISKIKKVDIHYIVVGGWLGDFIKKLPIHKFLLKRIKGIYPQTAQLCELLEREYSLNNVVQLHNFRLTIKKTKNIHKNISPVKLVFMARVHPKKGVETIFQLIDKLEREKIDYFSLDIYGPIVETFSEKFNKLLRESNGKISYHGVIYPDTIVQTLTNYDLLLFPTEYYTEGFPGTVLDAYLANIPVVVSKWKYADEFVENGKTGLISNFKDRDDFIDKVIFLLKNPYKIYRFKEYIIHYVDRFSPEKAWEILKNRI